GRASLHLHAELADRSEADRVVLARVDRLAHVEADLGGVDVEGAGDLDVADVVAAHHDVHETGHVFGRVGVAVVLEPLYERAGAVAHAGDGQPDTPSGRLRRRRGAAHCVHWIARLRLAH